MQKVFEVYFYAQDVKSGQKIYDQKEFESNFLDILFNEDESLTGSDITMLWGALAYCDYNQNPRATTSAYAIAQKIWQKLQKITCYYDEFSAQEITKIFQALALLQVQWNHNSFHPRLRVKLFQSLEHNLRFMEQYQIVTTLSALAHLFKEINLYHEIDDMQLAGEIYEGLFNAINRNAAKIALNDFSKILWACVVLQKKLGKIWSKMLDHQENNEFFLTLAGKISQQHNHELVKIIESLTHLFEHWNDLPIFLSQSLQQALLKHFTQLRGAELATTLWAIARSSFPWETLETSKQGIHEQILSATKTILFDLTPAQFSKVCWALAVLGINWQRFDFQGALVKRIKEKVAHGIQNNLFSANGINQLQQANIYFNWQLDNSFIKTTANIAAESHGSVESNWQQTVTRLIRKLVTTTPIETEYLIGHCKRVDICFPLKKRALELDGDFHQDKHGQLRRKDVLNQAVVEKLGYVVERITQQEWNKLSNEQHTAFLLSKLQHLGIIQPPISRQTPNEDKSPVVTQNRDLFFYTRTDSRTSSAINLKEIETDNELMKSF